MVGVTTVALLERKNGLPRSLFSRYWRDVHGVMAARIPGFESYTQYHVTPLDDLGTRPPVPTFEGIAIVTFVDAADRQGLVHSEVTKHIHRDEQNVFRGALLYSLPPGASLVQHGHLTPATKRVGCFMLVPDGAGIALNDVVQNLRRPGLLGLESHDLSDGDPASWNNTNVDEVVAGQRFSALLRSEWNDEASAKEAARSSIAASGHRLVAFRVDESYVMVEHGRPTPIGLRGLDSVRTIEQAGATNQFEPDVEDVVFGRLGRRA